MQPYPSPQQIGHRSIRNLFDGPVVVQEKLDGSQISFGIDSAGTLRVRSRGALLNLAAPDKMFAAGIASIQARKDKLLPEAIYRGEYLGRTKHNVLAYDRVPNGNIALFDVVVSGSYLPPQPLAAEATRLGFDSVPVIYEGALSSPEPLRAFLDRVSFLGGCKVEGVVVKNYALAGGEAFAGKFVSEAFKEMHTKTPKNRQETLPIQEEIVQAFRTSARWAKARQHLREAGVLKDSPADIGALIKEVNADIERECLEEIKERLYAHFARALRTGFVYGLPEWYKNELLADSFSEPAPAPADEAPETLTDS